MIKIVEAVRKGEVVELHYSDGEIVNVKYSDYNRAFGAIINAAKEDVKHDFEI